MKFKNKYDKIMEAFKGPSSRQLLDKSDLQNALIEVLDIFKQIKVKKHFTVDVKPDENYNFSKILDIPETAEFSIFGTQIFPKNIPDGVSNVSLTISFKGSWYISFKLQNQNGYEIKNSYIGKPGSTQIDTKSLEFHLREVLEPPFILVKDHRRIGKITNSDLEELNKLTEVISK